MFGDCSCPPVGRGKDRLEEERRVQMGGLGACHWPEAVGHEKGGDRKRAESHSVGLASGLEATGEGGPKDTSRL